MSEAAKRAAVLALLCAHYAVGSDEEVFIKAHREIIGGPCSRDCACTDYRGYSKNLIAPYLPAYVMAVYNRLTAGA